MPWIIYAGIVIFGATGIHYFSKLAKGTIDPVIALVYTTAAALAVSLCFLPLAAEPFSKSLALSKPVLLYVSVGACIALAHLGIFLMFKAGAPLSLATPLVRFAPAVLAVILGLIFFQETIKLHQWLGLGLAFISFYLITKTV